MRLRSPFVLKVLGVLIAGILRIWIRTVRIREHVEDPSIHPRFGSVQSVLCCTWHETILITAGYYGRFENVAVIVSNSNDGEMISNSARRLGWHVIRGSSSRGGAVALQGILAFHSRHSSARTAFTVDGPRGPRRKIKQGIVVAASFTGLPIVCAGIACEREVRAKSWDRLLLPRPFHRIEICVGPPISVPPNLSREQIQGYCQLLETEMDRLETKARGFLRKQQAAHAVVRDAAKAA